MLDFDNSQSRIEIIDQEDRALQRCNPSAWSMPEDGQEHVLAHMLLPSRSSFGYKAINLLSWCKAPIRVKQIIAHITGETYVSIYNTTARFLPNSPLISI